MPVPPEQDNRLMTQSSHVEASAPERQERLTRKIVLLSCSARKLDRPAPAAELYQGTLFKASLEWARQQAPDAIYILSAKHHLLALDEKIAPYDLTLKELPINDLRDWSSTVMGQLKRCTDPDNDHFVILAGEQYRRYLLPFLKHVKLPLKGLPIGKQVQLLQQQLAGEPHPAENEASDCGQLHRYMASLPRFHFPFDSAMLPDNGIYILFEQGESAHGTERIVRVGTHRGDGQLPGRIREHFINENKDRSIFRKNIGRALLNRDSSPLLEQWEMDLTTRKARDEHGDQVDHAAMHELEKKVSGYIRSNLSFCIIPVADKEARMRLETGLIATVNSCPQCSASSDWLGQHSPKEQIRHSGLWLVQGLKGKELVAYEWRMIEQGDTTLLSKSKPTPVPKRTGQIRRERSARLRGKYAPLTEFLRAAENDQVTLSFRQLEDILGFALPKSARKYRPWWANQKAPHMSTQSKSWQAAGFAVDTVRVCARAGENGWVRFRRIAG